VTQLQSVAQPQYLQQTAQVASLPAQLLPSLTALRSFSSDAYHATTVLCIRKDNKVVIMADCQVTRGNEIIKPNVKKVRRLGDKVIAGFAGATADAFTLFERLEAQLDSHSGQLTRAAVELAKQWRTDKFLRRLDAVMVVADAKQSLTITGNGDVLEPHDGIIAIGSGGSYALAASKALIDVPDMDAMAIAKKAMTIAADICIYTNHNFSTESLEGTPESE
jgi:ATP-dependent HslUV protease subunit HslV